MDIDGIKIKVFNTALSKIRWAKGTPFDPQNIKGPQTSPFYLLQFGEIF